MTPQQQIKSEIHKLLNKLHEAKNTNALYGMKDIADFMEHDLDKLGHLVDSLDDGYEQPLEVAKAS